MAVDNALVTISLIVTLIFLDKAFRILKSIFPDEATFSLPESLGGLLPVLHFVKKLVSCPVNKVRKKIYGRKKGAERRINSLSYHFASLPGTKYSLPYSSLTASARQMIETPSQKL